MQKIDLLYTFLKKTNNYQGKCRLAHSPLSWKLLSAILNLKIDKNMMLFHIKAVDFYESIVSDCYS
jgi:hypothetical protein